MGAQRAKLHPAARARRAGAVRGRLPDRRRRLARRRDGETPSCPSGRASHARRDVAERDSATRHEPARGAQGAPARSYIVKPGDNLAAIAEETGVPLEELRSLNPALDPQGLVAGQRVQAPRDRWIARRSAVARSAVGSAECVRRLRCRARWPLPLLGLRRAAAAERSPRVSARAAILVDARDGHVLYRRAPAQERADRVRDEADDGARRARRAAARPRRCAPCPTTPAPAESRIDLRAGERMAVADLLRALLLESANDAAETLARARGRVGATGSCAG